MRIGEGKPGFFAIASPPDPNNAGVVELLVKSIPDTPSEQIAQSKAGECHLPKSQGFTSAAAVNTT